jgi:hypothetical protein
MRLELESDEALRAQDLLGPFRERPLAVESHDVAEARLRRIVPHLEAFTQRAVASKRRRTQWTRVTWLLAALSTGVGAGVVYGRFSDETPALEGVRVSGELVQVGDQERTILSGSLEVSPLGRVETREVGAHISTNEGLDVELGPATSARIGQLGGSRRSQRVRLESGSIRCRVPKLGDGREFSVVTPDALVVVHGTRFSVEVRQGEDGEAQTCVRVNEGLVSVHGRSAEPVFLRPGEELGCAARKAALSVSDLPEVVDSVEVDSSEAPRASRGPARAGRSTSVQQGTLRKETALLQAAVRAEQRGDVAGARSRLNELLQKYPKSPLAEEARLMNDRLSSRQH